MNDQLKLIDDSLYFSFKIIGFKQDSVWMLSRKSIHWWIVIHDILLWINAVFSKTEIVQRVIDLVKPEVECGSVNKDSIIRLL